MKFPLRNAGISLLAVACGLEVGCASRQPFAVHDPLSPVALESSPYHEFTYVRVYERNGELVVYGKVRHEHEFCENEGHVDLVMEGSDGTRVASLPLRNQSARQRGWYGAAFRARLNVGAAPDVVRLAFHDDGCHAGGTYDCGDNRALNATEPDSP